MLKKIEEDFINNSMFHKTDKYVLLVVMILAIPYLYFFCFYDTIVKIISSIVLYLLSFLSFYIYMFIKVKNKNGIRFINFKAVIKLYKEFEREEDVINLGIILEKNKISDNKMIQELINHYQCLMPKNIKKGSEIIAYTSLIISFCALITNEYLINNMEMLVTTIFIILILLFLFVFYRLIIMNISVISGKNDIYRKMEAALEEIYFTSLVEKPDKTKLSNHQ